MKPKGRPPISKDGEKMRNRNFRATDADWAKCIALGGGAFLRAKIKTAKVGHNVELTVRCALNYRKEYTMSDKFADELSRLTAENELLSVNFTSVDELSKKLEAAEAENERLKEQLAAQGEPIAVVRITSPGNPVPKWCLDRDLSRVGALNDGDFLYAAPPLREGWVSVPRYATQKQINAMAKLDLPNTPYCEIYAAAITAEDADSFMDKISKHEALKPEPIRAGWVSVDESPSHGQEVIAYAPKGKNQTPELVRQCTYVSGYWYNGHCDEISGVTHWMPLPQSPLAASEEGRNET